MNSPEGHYGARRVLILDQEPYFLETLSMYLKDSDCRVLKCTSADSAMERFQSVHGEIDLFIADVAVANSVDAGIELKTFTPRLKLLLISDRPRPEWRIWDAALLCHLPGDSVRVLRKPFSALDLLKNVDALIGAQPEAGQFAGARSL